MNATNSKISVLLVGCGKMGGALLDGWLKKDICSHVTISDPADLPEKYSANNLINHITNIVEASDKYDVIMLATKPQIMDGVCESLKQTPRQDSLILSIAAGKTIEYFENYFGENQPIIRTMPNTPAAIGEGVSVCTPNKNVSETQKQMAQKLLSAGGMVEWLDDERLMDSVTALSGSGPAYIFYLIEVLEKAGTKIGLPKDLSAKLARQTVIGSAALAKDEKNIGAVTLRKNVTSPGGTTQAALDVLMNGELDTIYEKALTAARNRGKELSS